MKGRSFDILCVGELLIDLLSESFEETLDQAEIFRRIPGGSPANLCMNMARLGHKTRLAASLGQDDLGDLLAAYVERLGVDCSLLRRVDFPTTLILVTRSQTVSNFEAYRSADMHIMAGQLPLEALRDARLFHTTCFALSRPPAQESIMEAARQARKFNCQLSIDLNYADKIWPDREQAKRLVSEYCGLGAIVKLSEVDWLRLYQKQWTGPAEAARHFMDRGAQEVCVTLGSEGCYAARGNDAYQLPGRKVEVRDTTGAGDAFWAGYLSAWLEGNSLVACMEAGMRLAELKIQYFGPLPDLLDKALLFSPK